jgi:hypothetical protein
VIDYALDDELLSDAYSAPANKGPGISVKQKTKRTEVLLQHMPKDEASEVCMAKQSGVFVCVGSGSVHHHITDLKKE